MKGDFFMSDVFRLSKQGRIELDLFKELYLKSLLDHSDDSEFIKQLYEDHLNYSDSLWLEFAIRVACNHVRSSLN